jgi:hypothetical protein
MTGIPADVLWPGCGEARTVLGTDQEHLRGVLRHRHLGGHPDDMPDRSFPAVQALVRRV